MTRFFRLLDEAESILLSAIMSVMVLVYCSAIAVRFFIPAHASSVAWIDEATRFLLVWMVFIGLGLALAQGKHVAMSVFQQYMPPRLLQALRTAIDLTGLVFSIYVVWIGIEITGLVLGTGQRSPTLGVSAAILYAALPAGFALLALRYLASLTGFIDRWSASEATDADRGM